MFLFQNISGMDWLVWGLVVIALMVLNEAARANKWIGLISLCWVASRFNALCLANDGWSW